ncbi:transporter [Pectobacterium carotovorum subsp. carotovorum]|nr:transporter [Pectobacterium carotovorum subsp. carotovorum]
MPQERAGKISATRNHSILTLIAVFTIPPLLWAGNFIVGRAVRDDIPPVTLTLVRWLVALVIILPFALPHIRRDWPGYLQHAGRIVAISLSGIAAFSLLVYFGLHHTSGTNALLLNSCAPVLILLFSAVFWGARLNLRQIAGLLLSCVGVLIIIFRGDPRGLLALAFSSGDLLLLGAMTCFAFYTLWLRELPAEINRLGLLGVQVLITLIVVSLLWPWEHATGESANWNSTTLVAVLFLGAGPSFVSYLLFGRCVEMIGAARAGLSIHLIPVFGVALSLLFLGEPLHVFHIAGIATILIGVSFATSGKKGNQL